MQNFKNGGKVVINLINKSAAIFYYPGVHISFMQILLILVS